MAKMKEIFMELQEKFDGNIPSDFDFEKYISEKVEIKKSIDVNTTKECKV